MKRGRSCARKEWPGRRPASIHKNITFQRERGIDEISRELRRMAGESSVRILVGRRDRTDDSFSRYETVYLGEKTPDWLWTRDDKAGERTMGFISGIWLRDRIYRVKQKRGDRSMIRSRREVPIWSDIETLWPTGYSSVKWNDNESIFLRKMIG